MNLPTVTADDLAAYHTRIYGRAAPLHSLPGYTGPQDRSGKRKRSDDDDSKFAKAEDIDYEKDEIDWEIPDEKIAELDKEDDLGYYPDGVKRTLTDEQIAMFRHSELYAIQRQQEVARENREADGEEAEDEDEEEGEIVEDNDNFDSKANGHSASASNISLEKNPIPDNEPVPSTPHSSTTTHPPTQNPPRQTRNQRRKRNNNNNANNIINKERQSRAETRELDAVPTQEGQQPLNYADEELDYGDTASPPPQPTNAVDGTRATREGEGGGEGRKIWWPILAD